MFICIFCILEKIQGHLKHVLIRSRGLYEHTFCKKKNKKIEIALKDIFRRFISDRTTYKVTVEVHGPLSMPAHAEHLMAACGIYSSNRCCPIKDVVQGLELFALKGTFYTWVVGPMGSCP